MKPEQREELKAAAQRLHDARNAPLHIFNARQDEYRDLAPSSAILSLIAQVEALTVPQGWKCVPIEPTVEMREAAASFGGPGNGYNSLRGSEAVESYRHMLDAAPTIPAIPGTKEGA